MSLEKDFRPSAGPSIINGIVECPSRQYCVLQTYAFTISPCPSDYPDPGSRIYY